jgi:hypothetical protein
VPLGLGLLAALQTQQEAELPQCARVRPGRCGARRRVLLALRVVAVDRAGNQLGTRLAVLLLAGASYRTALLARAADSGRVPRRRAQDAHRLLNLGA